MWRRVYRIVVAMVVVRFRWAPLTWGVNGARHQSCLRIDVVSCTSTRVGPRVLSLMNVGLTRSIDDGYWRHWTRPATGPELFAAAAKRLLLGSDRHIVAKWLRLRLLKFLATNWALISWLVLTVLPQYPHTVVRHLASAYGLRPTSLIVAVTSSSSVRVCPFGHPSVCLSALTIFSLSCWSVCVSHALSPLGHVGFLHFPPACRLCLLWA